MAEKEAKKVVDVAHPGDSAPSDTSKPIIVKNRPIIKDPMMAEGSDEPNAELEPKKEEASSASEEHKVEVKTKPRIEVLGELKPSEELPEEPKEEKAEEPKSPVENPPAEPEKEEEQLGNPLDNEGTSDQGSKDDAALAKQAEEQAAKEAAMQKLVDSKKYFLPINTVEKRRSKRVLVVGIILSTVLALAWLDIALDAGIISLGNVHALTNFF